MSEVKVTLVHGLKVGKDLLKQVVLREAIAGDLIEAQEESEKLVTVFDKNGEPQNEFVPSPTMVSVHVLRRQIKAIGDMSGPLSLDLFKQLHPEDLNLLQAEANKIEAAAVQASEGLKKRGRPDRSGKSN